MHPNPLPDQNWHVLLDDELLYWLAVVDEDLVVVLEWNPKFGGEPADIVEQSDQLFHRFDIYLDSHGHQMVKEMEVDSSTVEEGDMSCNLVVNWKKNFIVVWVAVLVDIAEAAYSHY